MVAHYEAVVVLVLGWLWNAFGVVINTHNCVTRSEIRSESLSEIFKIFVSGRCPECFTEASQTWICVKEATLLSWQTLCPKVALPAKDVLLLFL